MGIEKFLFHPIVLGGFGVAMAIGLLIIGITIVLFKFLRKRIAEDILGMPAPGDPDSETWPYRNALGGKGVPIKCPWPCNEHKSLVDKLGGLDGELDQVEGRQKTLREDVLPEKYVGRREYEGCRKEHENCQRDRKSHESELFGRVATLEQRVGRK